MYMLILLLVLSFTIIIYINKRIKNIGILLENGIPGPKPNIFTGNLLEYRKGNILRAKEWIDKYGKICGFYLGTKPIVLVADPQLAKLIQIKDFNLFSNRPSLYLENGLDALPLKSLSVGRQRGQRWKVVRHLLSPAFSGAKLKKMNPLINDAIEETLLLIDKQIKCGQDFDIYHLFQNLSTDIICRTAFGVQTNIQSEKSNKFLNAVIQLSERKPNNIIITLIICFPFVDKLLFPLRRIQEILVHRLFGNFLYGTLIDMTRTIIKLRQESTNCKQIDLLQLMIDASILSDEITNTPIEFNGKMDKEIVHKLSEDEIIASAIAFYMGGAESTSTALAFIVHIFVNYPEVQEKCRREVQQLYISEGILDYNTVNRLPYMECVINETLRLYHPLIGAITRESLTDYNYNKLTIPKGATVLIALDYMHHDEEYWQEPNRFDPDRFSRKSADDGSWQLFGMGPRNCIAMRLAVYEIKLTLAKLLLIYRLECCPRTELGTLSTNLKSLTQTPEKGVFVKAKRI